MIDYTTCTYTYTYARYLIVVIVTKRAGLPLGRAYVVRVAAFCKAMPTLDAGGTESITTDTS